MQSADPTAVLETTPGQPELGPKPDPEDVLLADAVVDRWHGAERSRRRHMHVWEFIQAYFRGEQNLWQTRSGRVVRTMGRESKRLESQHNIMKLAQRKQHAKLTTYVPSFGVRAKNGDTDQTQAALAGTAFLEFLQEKESFEIKYLLATKDVSDYGVGYLAPEWDPDAGRRMVMCDRCGFVEEDIENVDEPCPSCVHEYDTALQAHEQSVVLALETEMMTGAAVPPPPPPQPQIGTLQEFTEGDLCIRYRPSREVVPEPGKARPEHWRYWFYRRQLPVSELRAKYPNIMHLIEPGEGVHTYSTSTVSSEGRDTHRHFETRREAGTELIYNEMPTEDFPKGRRIVIVNDKYLADYREEHPAWYIGRPDVYALRWDPENETFYPQPWAIHAWHRQKEYDENQTQLREASELLASSKVGIPFNSGVSPDELSAKSGQTFMYNHMVGMPKPLDIGKMPAEMLQRGDLLRFSIYDHAGISRTEQGVMDGDASGRLAAILAAEADKDMGPTLKGMWHELGQMMKACLLIGMRNYSNDYLYSVNGDQGLQVFTLREMNLQPGFDIDVEAEDGLSKNQQQRLQSMFTMLEMGLFSNQATGAVDVPRFVKAAKVRIPGIGGDSTTSQHTHAHFLMRLAEAGEFDRVRQEIKPWDDPTIHALVCLNWLETKGYNPKTPQLTKDFVYTIFQVYMSDLHQQVAPGMMAATAAQTGVASAGGPPANREERPGAGGQNRGQAQGARGAVARADAAAESFARSRDPGGVR